MIASKIKDISGQTFNHLTAIKFSHKVKQPNCKRFYHFWVFLCTCGNEVIKCKSRVMSLQVQSCGCQRKFINNPNIHTRKTHGMHLTRLYRIWRSMKHRCNSPNHMHYERYGGRGVKVCKRWEKFENFRDDMIKSYVEHCKNFTEKETTLDRIDNNGDYKKKNCRWITNREQHQNKSNTIYYTIGKVRKTLTEWSKEFGVYKGTIRERVKHGWDIEKAIKTKSLIPRTKL